jgi:MoaA/NifB/PqqE/SkfB family radical SAM enzyme
MSRPPQAGPPRVQIQTQSGCNARCVFCPNEAVLKSDLSQGRMPPELFQRMIDELALTAPRRVSLYLQNEPLLDKRLPEFTAYVAERIPKTSTLVTSNGTYLSDEVGAKLIDAGLKRLKVSIQSLRREVNMEIMGKVCDSDKIVANVLAMRKVMKEKRAKHFDLRVSTVVTTMNEDEIGEMRKFWKSHGIRLVTSALENRGGNIEGALDMNPGEMAVREDCIRPSREMCVLYNGDAVLCCVDWHRVEVAGNVFESGVHDVWNGLRLGEIRRALKAGDTQAMPEICVNCTESACPSNHRRGLKGLFKRALAGV